MEPIRIALAGVGDRAAALVRGARRPAGRSGGVEFVTAFDVVAAKVGRDLAHAVATDGGGAAADRGAPPTGVTVQRGPTYDGLGARGRGGAAESPEDAVDVVAMLKATGTDVLVCALPADASEAARFYAQCALDAGTAFVDAPPVSADTAYPVTTVVDAVRAAGGPVPSSAEVPEQRAAGAAPAQAERSAAGLE